MLRVRSCTAHSRSFKIEECRLSLERGSCIDHSSKCSRYSQLHRCSTSHIYSHHAIKTIYFHPLSHIPGPKAWIAFPLLQHLSAIRGKLDLDLRHWHEKYGTAVRFSPDEVSFITAEAWKDINSHGHPQLPKVHVLTTSGKDNISANDVDHARFRKALSHGFSAKGLQAQECIIMRYIDKLIERLKGFAESGRAADMDRWYNLTTFDLIGDLAFGEPFGRLGIGGYHHRVTTVVGFMKAMPFMQGMKQGMKQYPESFRAIFAFMPGSLSVIEARSRLVEHAKVAVHKRLNNPAAHGRGDFMDAMLRHHGDKQGLSLEEIEENAKILILAGSETTAALDKVTREVRAAFASETDIMFNQVTTKLPYMLACLNEALRLYPPAPGGSQRSTEVPTWVSGYRIAANVSVHQSAAYSSPRNFHQADKFIPERWLPEAIDHPASPFLSDNRDVFQPLSIGPRNCIGRNLAYTEMRMILARLLWTFDLELCEESRDWKNQKIFCCMGEGPLDVQA